MKICGVTSVAQAGLVAELGVDAIGVNLVQGSPRRVTEDMARDIARAVGGMPDGTGRGGVLVVAVVAGLPAEALQGLKERTGVGCLQLHGDEPDGVLEALLPHAYKAFRVGRREDVEAAERCPGAYVMVDAKVAGALGGTGHTFDWDLVVGLAQRRKLVLAGGLRPDTVAGAVARVRPYCVDVASGVESAPGVKDLGLVRDFLAAARSVAIA